MPMAIGIVVAIATDHGFATSLVYRNLTLLLLLYSQFDITSLISRRGHVISNYISCKTTEGGVDSQACGRGFVLMSSDYHNNQSFGSLSEHQPV